MNIVRDETCRFASGDFGAKIVNGDLHIPAKLYDKIEDGTAQRDAELLLSYLEAFPTGVMRVMRWSIDEVRAATDKLKQLLTGHVRDEFLHPAPPIQRPLGALMPPGWKPPRVLSRKRR